MADVKKLAEELVNLKVTEVNELATILKRFRPVPNAENR